MPEIIDVSWGRVMAAIDKLCEAIPKDMIIYPVIRGGIIPSGLILQRGHVWHNDSEDWYADNGLIVDDIIDGGSTRLKYENYKFASLFARKSTLDKWQKDGIIARTYYGELYDGDIWWKFPWEISREPRKDHE